MTALLGGALLLDWNAPSLAASPAYFCRLDLRNGKLSGHGGSCPGGQPGSIMKLVTTSALLESHRLDPDETFNCPGELHKHGFRFRCQKAHGKMTLTEALAQSCNLYFVQAMERLSSKQWLGFAERWGLLEPMNPKAGYRFPDAQHLQPTPHLYGLGLTEAHQTDAWQLLRMAALIARRGQTKGLGAFALPDPEFSPETWRWLQTGMRRAVRTGTAIGLDADNAWQAAAKTGTTPHGKSYQSWVMGYFPFDAPTTAFCLRAYEGSGKERAVPLARQALKAGW